MVRTTHRGNRSKNQTSLLPPLFGSFKLKRPSKSIISVWFQIPLWTKEPLLDGIKAATLSSQAVSGYKCVEFTFLKTQQKHVSAGVLHESNESTGATFLVNTLSQSLSPCFFFFLKMRFNACRVKRDNGAENVMSCIWRAHVVR